MKFVRSLLVATAMLLPCFAAVVPALSAVSHATEESAHIDYSGNFVSPSLQVSFEEPSKTDIVYATRTGHKYHRAGCRYLRYSAIKMTREEAEQRGLTPCSVCNRQAQSTIYVSPKLSRVRS
jgi:hypothetical protein